MNLVSTEFIFKWIYFLMNSALFFGALVIKWTLLFQLKETECIVHERHPITPKIWNISFLSFINRFKFIWKWRDIGNSINNLRHMNILLSCFSYFTLMVTENVEDMSKKNIPNTFEKLKKYSIWTNKGWEFYWFPIPFLPRVFSPFTVFFHEYCSKNYECPIESGPLYQVLNNNEMCKISYAKTPKIAFYDIHFVDNFMIIFSSISECFLLVILRISGFLMRRIQISLECHDILNKN